MTNKLLNTPLVSIIMPVYNVEPYLHQCLQSVLNQTYKNLEILIVEDCSTDGSRAIVQQYAQQDNRIKLLLNNPKLGISTTRNKALAIATGEYCCFIDPDDYVDLGYVEQVVNAINTTEADMIMAAMLWESPTATFLDIKPIPINIAMPFSSLKAAFEIIQCNAPQFTIKTTIIRDNNLTFAKDIVFEDILFMWQAIALSNKGLAYVQDLGAYYHYRVKRLGSVTGTKNKLPDRFYSLQRLEAFFKQHNLLDDKLKLAIHNYRDSAAQDLVWCAVYATPLKNREYFTQQLTNEWSNNPPSTRFGRLYIMMRYLILKKPAGWQTYLKLLLIINKVKNSI